MSTWERHRAARVVAASSVDATDAADLLDMLGLTAAEGREPAAEPAPPPPRYRACHADRMAGRQVALATVETIRRPR